MQPDRARWRPDSGGRSLPDDSRRSRTARTGRWTAFVLWLWLGWETVYQARIDPLLDKLKGSLWSLSVPGRSTFRSLLWLLLADRETGVQMCWCFLGKQQEREREKGKRNWISSEIWECRIEYCAGHAANGCGQQTPDENCTHRCASMKSLASPRSQSNPLIY